MSSTQEVGDIFGTGKGPTDAMLRSPIVLIVAVGLWGMNVFFYKLFGIPYQFVLQYDLLKEKNDHEGRSSSGGGNNIGGSSHKNNNFDNPGSSSRTGIHHSMKRDEGLNATLESDHIPVEGSNPSLAQQHHSNVTIDWYKLVLLSIALLLLLQVTTRFWMESLGGNVVGAVLLFYASCLALVGMPGNAWLRKASYLVLQRICALLHPRCWCLRIPFQRRRQYERLQQQQPQQSSSISTAGSTTQKHKHRRQSSTTGILPVIPRAIPFIDVFFADAMCSLSKVFFDWGILLHLASHHYAIQASSITSTGASPSSKTSTLMSMDQDIHNIIIPMLFAAWPYLLRARQCWIMYTIGRMTQDSKRYQHVANAVKYSTSIWPLLLSAYQKTLTDSSKAQSLNPLLYFLQTINALYALYWDIVMDWGMMQNPQALVSQACVATTTTKMVNLGADIGSTTSGSSQKGATPDTTTHHVDEPKVHDTLSTSALHGIFAANGNGSNKEHHPRRRLNCGALCLRPRLRFGLIMSALILGTDALLRFSWLLRFVAHHQQVMSSDALVLLTQFLEVFRRSIWNLLRVEWEHMKQTSNQLKARDSLSDIEEDDNDDDTSDLQLIENVGAPSAPPSLSSIGGVTSASLNSTGGSTGETASKEQELVQLLVPPGSAATTSSSTSKLRSSVPLSSPSLSRASSVSPPSSTSVTLT